MTKYLKEFETETDYKEFKDTTYNTEPSVNYIKMMATDTSATSCLYSWVSGVNSSGTFIKNANTTIPTGTSGIPSGWTVLTE